MNRVLALGMLGSATFLLSSSAALAEEGPSIEKKNELEPLEATPAPYLVTAMGTTLGYRPHDGKMGGPLGDLSPMVGAGFYVSRTVALELDVGVTMTSEGYGSFALTPGLVWNFAPHVYAAARVIVPVDPRPDLVLSPGLGAFLELGSFAPFVEVDVTSAVGHGEPDLGVTGSAGVSYSF